MWLTILNDNKIENNIYLNYPEISFAYQAFIFCHFHFILTGNLTEN